jgi:hypothetical protein
MSFDLNTLRYHIYWCGIVDDCRIRSAIDTGKGYYRPITPERKEGINNFYEQAALTMYNGFVNLMEECELNGNIWQKQIAAIFNEVQK